MARDSGVEWNDQTGHFDDMQTTYQRGSPIAVLHARFQASLARRISGPNFGPDIGTLHRMISLVLVAVRYAHIFRKRGNRTSAPTPTRAQFVIHARSATFGKSWVLRHDLSEKCAFRKCASCDPPIRPLSSLRA